MPHTRSAKKNARKSLKRKLRNRAVKKDVKLQLKEFHAALDGPIDELKKQYNLAAKRLDKAAARRIIHPNLAARKKSQLARAMHAKQNPPAPEA
jgi:small subunit ribosomal protein S20